MPQSPARTRAASRAVPAGEFRAFVAIVRRLRKECPWDRKQTHRSLRGGLLEETYETLDALDRRDAAALAGELGDILLHVALHAVIAEEAGEFTLPDVLKLPPISHHGNVNEIIGKFGGAGNSAIKLACIN